MPPYNKLVFTYIGYEPVEVLVKEQRTVNVAMEEAKATLIDEVVVTGTGVQKKIAVTGAVTNVDIAELKTTPSTSMADALAGVVPGIQAMQPMVVRGQFLSSGYEVFLLLVQVMQHWF